MNESNWQFFVNLEVGEQFSWREYEAGEGGPLIKRGTAQAFDFELGHVVEVRPFDVVYVATEEEEEAYEVELRPDRSVPFEEYWTDERGAWSGSDYFNSPGRQD